MNLREAIIFSQAKLHARMKIAGMDVSIENRKGSVRKGKRPDGTQWKKIMRAHYGYIRKTEGDDGEHFDVYIGPNLESNKVFIVHQVKPEDDSPDEDKGMIGFNSLEQAKDMYLYHIPRKFFGDIEETTMEEFKSRVLLDGKL